MFNRAGLDSTDPKIYKLESNVRIAKIKEKKNWRNNIITKSNTTITKPSTLYKTYVDKNVYHRLYETKSIRIQQNKTSSKNSKILVKKNKDKTSI